MAILVLHQKAGFRRQKDEGWELYTLGSLRGWWGRKKESPPIAGSSTRNKGIRPYSSTGIFLYTGFPFERVLISWPG